MKLLGLGTIMTGVVFLLLGGVFIFLGIFMGELSTLLTSVLTLLSTFATGIDAASYLSMMQFSITLSYIIGAIIIIAAIMNLIAGIKLMFSAGSVSK